MNHEEETPKRGIHIPMEPEDPNQTTQLNLTPAQLENRAREAARKAVREKWQEIKEEEEQQLQAVRKQVDDAQAPTRPNIKIDKEPPQWSMAKTQEHKIEQGDTDD